MGLGSLRIVPAHFQDPVGLALRLLASRDRDALAAMGQAGLKLGLAPLDVAFARLLKAEDGAPDTAPSRPVLLITGPPRSGTTLLHQVLIRALPVAYVSNLASLLPHSARVGAFPMTAGIANRRVRFESYYGRTRSLTGASDGLEFWDRWLGADRRAVPSAISESAAREMRAFFARLERLSGRPVVAKNNNLLGSAHLVADALPTVRFVCLAREPLMLAQSLLKARSDIQGSPTTSYGIDERTGACPPEDVPTDVWRQVGYYERLATEQHRRLGERFLTVRYERLCEDPAATARAIGRAVLGFEGEVPDLPALAPRRGRTLPAEAYARLAASSPVHDADLPTVNSH